MKGATAKAEQFFTRTGNESTKGSRKGFSLLGGGVDPSAVLTPEQARLNKKAALTARLSAAHKEMAEQKEIICRNRLVKNQAFFDALERRAELITEYQSIVEQLSAFKQAAKPKTLPGLIERCFVDICKETMTTGQFKSIMTAATSKAEAIAAAPLPNGEIERKKTEG